MQGHVTLLSGQFTAEVLTELQVNAVNKNNILLFLNDEDCKQALMSYLDETRTTENLLCWLEMREYKTLREEEMAEKGKCIYSKYVTEDSDLCVSISYQLRKELEQIQKYDRTTFVGLEQAAFLMLSQCNFPSFFSSAHFKDLFARVDKKGRTKKKKSKGK